MQQPGISLEFYSSMSISYRVSSIKRQLNVPDAVESKPRLQRKSLVDQGLERASWNEALNFRIKQSNHTHKGKSVSFFVSNEYFKQFGPGTYLFFLFADKLMKVFIIMSLLTIPTLYSNYSGDGMASVGASGVQARLMGFSFGNQLTNSTYYSSLSYNSELTLRYYTVVIPDFVYSLVFLLFIFYWEYRTNEVVKQMKQESELPSYYCVTISNLPKFVNDEQVRTYMEQFGTVKEVAEVRNYDETIGLSKRIYDKTISIRQERLKLIEDQNQSRIDQLRRDIDQCYEDLNRCYFMGDVIMYFVSFGAISVKEESVKSMANLSRFSYESALCCGCKSDSVPQKYLIGDKLPVVKHCEVQPGSIIWENIHLGSFSRLLRWIAQTVFIIIASVVSFIGLSLVNIASPQYSFSSLDTSSYTYNQVVAGSNSSIVEAWCLSQDPTDVLASSSLLSLCATYLNSYYSALGISICISVGVVVVKLVLEKVVYYISRFQRPASYNQQTSSLTINYFVIYFVTTFILTILLQAQICGISFKYLILTFLSDPYLIANLNSLGTYSDFTRNWYAAIGYKICITWIISSLVPHLYDPLVQLITEKINDCRAKKQLIQRAMNQMINPKEFAFEQHYANMLLVVFGALTLGGPIPFLIIFATIALVTKLIYWRIMFIRFSRIPPTFDESLNNNILKVMPWALIIHVCVSVYSYGADSIFPAGLGTGLSVSQSVISNYTSNQYISPFLTTILLRTNLSLILTVLGVLTLLLTVGKLFLYDPINYIVRMCKTEESLAISRKVSIAADEDKNFVKSYLIEKNQNYEEILAILRSVMESKNVIDT